MIFASDLDRTLIYSNRFITGQAEQNPIIVEYYKGEPISWVTSKALEHLKLAAERTQFVPITTRSLEQFNRIMLWQWMPHKYAVTTNGANLMINGEPDKAWNSTMKKRIETECQHPEKVRELLNQYKDKPWMVKVREVEQVFHYYVVEESLLEKELIEELRMVLAPVGWDVLYNGRKIYFIPRILQKASALQRIMEMEGETRAIAAGDTILDVTMANVAGRFLVPGHGDLEEMKGPNVEVLEVSGMEAAEVICTMVLKSL